MKSIRSPFLGIHTVNIDQKQRLPIPAPLREALKTSFPGEADSVIVTIASTKEPALVVYPVSGFNQYISDIMSASALNEDAQEVVNFLTSNAQTCSMDAQGRIRLQAELMAEVGLEPGKPALFSGNWDKIHIYEPGTYKASKRTVSEMRQKLRHVDEMNRQARSPRAAVNLPASEAGREEGGSS